MSTIEKLTTLSTHLCAGRCRFGRATEFGLCGSATSEVLELDTILVEGQDATDPSFFSGGNKLDWFSSCHFVPPCRALRLRRALCASYVAFIASMAALRSASVPASLGCSRTIASPMVSKAAR